MTSEQRAEIVDTLILKGFLRIDALYLTAAIDAGMKSSKLRDEIGTYGMGVLERAVDRLINPETVSAE